MSRDRSLPLVPWLGLIAACLVTAIAALYVLRQWPNSVLGLALTALALILMVVAFETV